MARTTIIDTSSTGFIPYYSGAYTEFVDSTGVGKLYNTSGLHENFVVGASTDLSDITARIQTSDLSTLTFATANIITGSAGGDIRGTGDGYFHGGTLASQSLNPSTLYYHGLYAPLTGSAGVAGGIVTGIIGSGANASTFAQGSYTGSFTTDKIIYNFAQTYDSGTQSGSGIYRDKNLNLGLSIIDRIGREIDENHEIIDNPFISGTHIDILNSDGTVKQSEFKSAYREANLVFNPDDNENVFGEFTTNFGVRTRTVSFNGEISTGNIFLYGNRAEINSIRVQDATGSFLDQNPVNFISPNSGFLNALPYTNHQPTLFPGIPRSGSIAFQVSFENIFTKYKNLEIYGTEGDIDSLVLNDISRKAVINVSNNRSTFSLNTDNGLKYNTDYHFKIIPSSDLETGRAWTIGPYKMASNKDANVGVLNDGTDPQNKQGGMAIDTTETPNRNESFAVGGAAERTLIVTNVDSVNSIAGDVGIATNNPQQPLDAANVARANIAASDTTIVGNDSAALAGSGHVITGDDNVIAGGGTASISGGNFNFIGGGSSVNVDHSTFSSSVGGFNNDILSGSYSVIGGGRSNLISGKASESHSDNTAILGGQNNRVLSAPYSFIGGGAYNLITGSSSLYSSIIGGNNNHITNSLYGVILGGDNNKINSANTALAAGNYSTVQAGHDGAFVLSDSRTAEYKSTGGNTLNLRFESGVFVDTDSGIFINGNPVMTGSSPEDVDTLQIVTDRGATTTNAVSLNGGASITKAGQDVLTVNRSDAGTAYMAINPFAGDAILKFQTNGSDNFAIGKDGTDTSFRIAEGGALETNPRLVIKNGGNVGIGTDDPQSRLHIGNANASNSGLRFTNSTETVNQYFADDSTDSDFFITYAGNGGAEITLQHDGKLALNAANGDNVGVGTDNPRTSLHVSRAGTTEGGIITIDNPNNSDGSYCGIEFINSTVGYPRSAIFAMRTGGYDAELTFHTSPTNEITGTDYPAATERMRIDHDGSVGIGTNTPDEKLHINSGHIKVQSSPVGGVTPPSLKIGQVNNAYQAGLISSTHVTLKSTNGAGNIYFQPGNAYRGIVQSDGKMGVNTITPNSTLHVEGDITGAGDVLGTGVGNRITNNGTPYLLSGDAAGGGSVGTLQEVTDNGATTTNAISIHNTSAGGNPRLSVGRETSQAIEINVDDSNNTITARQDTDNDADHKFILNRVLAGTGENDFQISKAGTAQLTIDTDGNVGIGNDNPGQKLSVNGNISPALNVLFNDNYGINFGNSNARVYGSSSDGIKFNAGGSEAMRLTQAGNVGIGTTAPTVDLDISGSLGSIRATSSAGGANLFLNSTAGNLTRVRWNSAAGSFAIRDDSNSSDRVTIDSDGNVGIGVADASQKLEVATNTDVSAQIGRAQVGYMGFADFAGFSHIDSASTSNYALLQSSAGSTYLNKAAGQQIYFRNGNAGIGGFNNYDDFYVDTDTLYVDASTDRVGIGTISPSVQLDIEDSSNVILDLNTTTSDANTTIRFREGSSNKATIGYEGSADGLVLAAGGFTAGNGIFINDSNNVGIGAASPLAKLDVRGDVSGSGDFLGTGIGNRITASDGKPYLVSGDEAGATNTLQDVCDNGNTTTTSVTIGNDLIVDTDALFVDVSANRVGINEDSVDATLHMTNVGGGVVNQKFERAGASAWRLGIPNGQTYFAFDDTNDSLSTPKVVITKTDGNVGIGSATPRGKLDIVGNTDNDTDFLTIQDDDPSAGSHRPSIRFRSDSAQIGQIASLNNGMRFSVGTSEDSHLEIREDTKNVGIGTNSPVSKLTVESTANALADVDEPENHHLLLRNPANDTTEGVGMGFLVSAATSDVGAAIVCKRIGNNAQSELQFWNKQNTTVDGVITQSMTISEEGNVGIGTNDPSRLLELYNDSSTVVNNSQLRIHNAGAGDAYIYLYAGSDWSLGIDNSDTDKFKICTSNDVSDGNSALTVTRSSTVGIGTDTVNEKLHVNGKTVLGGRGQDGGAYIAYATFSETQGGASTILGNAVYAGTASNTYRKTYNDAGNFIRMTYNKGICFHTNVTGNAGSAEYSVEQHEQMRIDLNGNVGIGTNSPAQKLEVVGQAIIDGGVGVDSSATLHLRQKGDTLNDGLAITSSHATSHRIWKDGNGKLNIGPTSLPSSFVQDLNGNVGIGTNTPAVNLHVESSTSAQFKVGNGTQFVRLYADADEATILADGSVDMRFYTAGAEKMRLDTDGNLGLGVTDPDHKLHVNGTIAIKGGELADTARIHFQASDESNRFTLESDFNSTSTTDLLGFRSTTADNILVLKGDGNVGIGTNSPSNALDVVGHFSATSKSFLIDHPTKENKKLQYASLEGPENGVYVRGTTNSALIELPDYWSALVHEDSITVVLTPIGKKQDLYIKSKSPETVIIGGVKGYYDYVVYGERKDIDKLEIEPLKV